MTTSETSPSETMSSLRFGPLTCFRALSTCCLRMSSGMTHYVLSTGRNTNSIMPRRACLEWQIKEPSSPHRLQDLSLSWRSRSIAASDAKRGSLTLLSSSSGSATAAAFLRLVRRDAVIVRGLAGEERRPARRAEREIHEAVLERHALRGERLNVRQIGSGAGVFLIVGEDDDNVRRRHGAGEEREKDEESAKKCAHGSCPAVPNVAPSDAVRLAGG